MLILSKPTFPKYICSFHFGDTSFLLLLHKTIVFNKKKHGLWWSFGASARRILHAKIQLKRWSWNIHPIYSNLAIVSGRPPWNKMNKSQFTKYSSYNSVLCVHVLFCVRFKIGEGAHISYMAILNCHCRLSWRQAHWVPVRMHNQCQEQVPLFIMRWHLNVAAVQQSQASPKLGSCYGSFPETKVQQVCTCWEWMFFFW